MSAPTARVADAVAVLDSRYDPRWAQPWDAVGTVCGDPDAPLRSVLFAVDPVAAVVEEAVRRGVDLLVCHHPLLLRPVHGVAATTPKGRVVHRLVTAGVALHVAHTNADVARPGVSDALAAAVGLSDLEPLAADDADPLDKVVTFVPHADVDAVVDALAAAGAGAIGDYRRCAWTVPGDGTFEPLPGAAPAVGSVGSVARVGETRVEMVLPPGRRGAVVAALRAAHPYEEPAYDVVSLAPLPGDRGLGRIGRLDRAEPLARFTARVARALPVTAHGVRVQGDPARRVQRVAVCGGAGDSLLDVARGAGVDAYLTADLRHHPASESAEAGGPALLDAAHWATEWPWLPQAAAALRRGVAERTGATVDVHVSTLLTDPWTTHVAAEEAAPPDEGPA